MIRVQPIKEWWWLHLTSSILSYQASETFCSVQICCSHFTPHTVVNKTVEAKFAGWNVKSWQAKWSKKFPIDHKGRWCVYRLQLKRSFLSHAAEPNHFDCSRSPWRLVSLDHKNWVTHSLCVVLFACILSGFRNDLILVLRCSRMTNLLPLCWA